MLVVRNLIRTFIALIAVIFIASIIFQIKVESYRNEVVKSYGLYEDLDRLSYKPYSWFYVESKLFGKHDLCWSNINLPYEEKGALKNGYVVFNIEFNAYLMSCYYECENLPPRPMSSCTQCPP